MPWKSPQTLEIEHGTHGQMKMEDLEKTRIFISNFLGGETSDIFYVHPSSRPDPIGQVTYANQVSEGHDGGWWMLKIIGFFNGWKAWQIP